MIKNKTQLASSVKLFSHLVPFSQAFPLGFICLLALAFAVSCKTNQNIQPQANAPAISGFDLADANKDGKLTRREASDFLANETFNSRDANHDGKLTKEEYGAHEDAPRMREFKKRDANGDGIITHDEAMKYARAHGVMRKAMSEADKNHDGYLSKEEVAAYYASREGKPR